MVVIKASFGGDLKRFELDEKSLSWNTLKEELRRRFELEPACQFFVKYHDAEGDLITLSCDTELRESLSSIETKNGKSVLRLEFTVSTTILSSEEQALVKEEKEEEKEKIEQVIEELKQIEEEIKKEEEEKEIEQNEKEEEEKVEENEEQRIIEELEKQREEEQKRIEKEFQQKIEAEKRKFAEEQKRKLEEEEQRKKVEEERQKMEQEKKRIEELQKELEEKERKLEEEKRRAEERNKLEEEEERKKRAQEQEKALEEEKRRIEEQKRKEQENQKVLANKKVHSGVVCNNCKTQITGIRYKCGNCSDFDFCESCEGQDLHNPNHVFIKIKTPLSCTISSQCRRALLPNLYPLENFESNTQSTNQPSVITLRQLSTPTLSLSTASSSSSSSTSSTSSTSTNPNTIIRPMTQQVFFEAQFVRDVNFPDGTIVTGGKIVNKKWRMKNSGSQTWPTGTKLVYVGGDETKGTKSVPVPSIKPNEEVDITIPIMVPKKLGRFLTLWRLQSSAGENFGHRIWCDLVVAEEEPETLVIPEDSINMIPYTGSITPPQLVSSTEMDFTQQMSELVVMGFNDRTRNLRLLTKHQGDLQETINELCSE